MHPLKTLAIFLAACCLAGADWADAAEDDAEPLGRVEVDTDALFGDAKPSLSLELDKQTLEAVFGGTNLEASSDEIAGCVDFVRIETFDLNKKQSKRAAAAVSDLTATLAEEDWEEVVNFSESDQSVGIYFKKSWLETRGMLIVLVQPGEAVVVNVAGILDPATLKDVVGDFLAARMPLGEYSKMIAAKTEAYRKTERVAARTTPAFDHE